MTQYNNKMLQVAQRLISENGKLPHQAGTLEPTQMNEAAQANQEDPLIVGFMGTDPDDQSNTQRLIAVGSLTLPIESATPSIERFVKAAALVGHLVPDKFLFASGQIFYKNQRIEEVRLRGISISDDTSGNEFGLSWETPTPPQFTVEGQKITVSPEDVGRTHLTASIVAASLVISPATLTSALTSTLTSAVINSVEANSEEEEQKQVLLQSFDLRGNSFDHLPLEKSNEFSVHTGQEWSALTHLASDGRLGRYLTSNEQLGSLRHQRPGAPFFAEVALSDEERDAGHGIELLRQATQELDFDDGFIMLYVSHLLAPPEPLSPRLRAAAWIDLDDVARKTLGGYETDATEAQRRREKVYHAIRYAARAHIGGARSSVYFNKQTGEKIDTRILTSPWKIMSREEPVQASLFPSETVAVPLRIELVASQEWTALTTSRDTAQYLPFGEVLGSIPGNQPGGAWARSLGFAYLHWCRIKYQDALRGEAPTRRELLDAYPAKKAFYQDVLSSKDPRRALKYWKDAEDHLRAQNMIEAPASDIKPPVGYKWQEGWLEARPTWTPGPLLRSVLESIAQNRFEEKPRQLSPLKRKRGRPRKNPPPEA